MPESPPPALDAPRLLIAMSAARRDLSGLDTAARLAHIIGASLRALLIEDPVLAQAADLPLTREYDRRSGSERVIDQPRVTRHLRIHQRAARERLQGLADALKLSSTLHVASGDYLREAMKAALEADFALIDPRNAGRMGSLSDAERRWLFGRPGTRASAAPQASRNRIVWAVCGDDSENDRVLTVARAIALSESARLALLNCADTSSLEAILRQVRPQAGGLLVLSHRLLKTGTAQQITQTLTHLPCPVLLVD